jgi:NAD(P)-dependent dehydrogenase (short-subunit alcohol dehydrogenase family)
MRQTILVTGTSTGLGFATAVSLARAGHDVFASMRNPAGAPELRTVAAHEKLPITILTLDVDSDASVAAAVKSVIDARGRIDALINNAGIGLMASIEHMPLDQFRQVFETNYFGVLRCIKAVLPYMRAQQSGRIVNMSSVAGRIASAGHGAYASSKFALEAISESLAAEVRPFNIRVHVVEPAVTQSTIFEKMGDLSGDLYPGARRLDAIFAAALEQPVPASVVGDLIRDLVASDSWQLRYPAGPGAAPFLGWRGSLTDEQFVALGALDDDAWCDYFEQTFKLPVRRHLAAAGASIS